MSILNQLSNKETLPNGVYLLNETTNVDELKEDTNQAGLIFFYLDGERIVKEMDLFKQISFEMLFSGEWGENWESLRNVLVDFFNVEAPKEKGYVLLYDHFEIFAEHEPNRFEICLYMFKLVANRKSLADKRILFLLRGYGDKPYDVQHSLPVLRIE